MCIAQVLFPAAGSLSGAPALGPEAVLFQGRPQDIGAPAQQTGDHVSHLHRSAPRADSHNLGCGADTTLTTKAQMCPERTAEPFATGVWFKSGEIRGAGRPVRAERSDP